MSEDQPFTDGKNDSRIVIDYFSDVLCVWAWVSQPRLEEVLNTWAGKVTIRYRYMDVFGDAHAKITTRWGERDGFERFAEHLREVTSDHVHAPVHAAVWTRTRPTTSLMAHSFIKAAELVGGQDAAAAYALSIRQAFFARGMDISRRDVLDELAGTHDSIDPARLQRAVDDGSALAGVARDARDAAAQTVKGSPTWVLNEGRQMLYGNVGYRILSANIEELLTRDAGGASWC